MEKKAFIEAGRIVNTHGVQGEVKIEVWLDSPQFFKRFRRLYTADGTEWGVVSARAHKDFVIAKLAGVEDVNAAMELKNKTLSIRREDARLPKGSFFLQARLSAHWAYHLRIMRKQHKRDLLFRPYDIAILLHLQQQENRERVPR